jgi:dihydrolipoamide dehydrogenase
MVPDIMPGTLLVIGSGAIGIEFASFYRSLGAEVTVVEILDRILPAEDDEISTLARGQFEKQGIVIHTCTSVKALKKSENTVMATLEGGDKRWDVSADRVILAVGIVGNVETCGLEGSGIRVEKSHIVVDNGVARTN